MQCGFLFTSSSSMQFVISNRPLDPAGREYGLGVEGLLLTVHQKKKNTFDFLK